MVASVPSVLQVIHLGKTLKIFIHKNKGNVELFPSSHLVQDSKKYSISFTESKNLLWKEWCFMCIITIVCFMYIILWGMFEKIQEIRKGHGFYKLPRILRDDPTTVINFIHSKDGITLLGSQQAVNEVALGITDDY
ncbi:uncharacterized protein LOC143356991 [Halictus rubicundus]|uniref:uncharacterized protein LOC143356991 n=1 Tax=Halictus rubicundus TaxID=77578 RepID=UPI0040355022